MDDNENYGIKVERSKQYRLTSLVPRFRKLQGWFTRFHHFFKGFSVDHHPKGKLKLMIFANDGNKDFQGPSL